MREKQMIDTTKMTDQEITSAKRHAQEDVRERMDWIAKLEAEEERRRG